MANIWNNCRINTQLNAPYKFHEKIYTEITLGNGERLEIEFNSSVKYFLFSYFLTSTPFNTSISTLKHWY